MSITSRTTLHFARIALAVTILVALPRGGFAQGNATGTLSGSVASSDGQPLPGVSITISSPALQGTRSTTSSAHGDYIFSVLPAGDYELGFELAGFAGVRRKTRLALAQTVRVDATLGVASVQETVVVEARPAGGDFQQTAPVASSYRGELVDHLPLDRSFDKTALLSPGVQATGPGLNSGSKATAAISISGAMSYESLFLINGVVVNENIRGQSLDLFIEDAIEETTTTTGALSAEYGRFAGGVVQAVTKSGGNDFHGSFRVSFDNDSWRSTTPFGEPKLDRTVPRYEATLGGPILKDRLWFFAAARRIDDEVANQTRFTNIGYTQEDRERRYEGKLTWAIAARHNFKASVTSIARDRTNQAFGTVMDQASLYDRSDPQQLVSLHYAATLSPSLFLEAQYSHRQLTFEGSGSRFSDLARGTLLLDQQRGSARYHSPTFCAVCGPPETRANDNLLLKATWFLSTGGAGSHTLVAGFDSFADERFANNHQSGSDYRVFSTTSIIRGSEVLPVFANDGTSVIRWTPIFVDSQGNSFKTHSLFLNDNWRLHDRLTLSLGARYDKNDGVEATGQTVVKDGAFSPRVALSFDPGGDGRLTLNAGFAKYVAGISNTRGDSGSAGGVPSAIDYVYLGPAINTNPSQPLLSGTEALEALFGWFGTTGGTSRPVSGSPTISGVNTRLDERLASPHARELTLGVTRRLGARGLVRLDGVLREYRDFYSSRIDLGTGQVTDPFLGQRLDVTQVENTSAETRRYQGLNLQLASRPHTRLQLAGNYTLSRSYGTLDGETRVNGPITSTLASYPEYQDPRWSAPEGDLSNDRRHRGRLWAIWQLPLPQWAGELSLGALQYADSGLPYGAVGLVDARPFVANPGYATPPRPPAFGTYYFTARDAFRTDSVFRTDLNLSWSRQLARGAELFFRGVVLNLFDGTAVGDNNDNRVNLAVLTRSNTARLQAFDPFSVEPVLGTHWEYGSSRLADGTTAAFGEPISRDAYQAPRSFSFSVGVRF